jgi:hypothetical protein
MSENLHHAEAEQISLRENLRTVEDDRNTIVQKMSSELNRNELLSSQINTEKENMLWLHSRHSRLISSRSMFFNLEKIVSRRYFYSLDAISWFRRFRDTRFVMTRKLWHILNRYYGTRARACVRMWAGRLDWRTT